MVTAIWAFEKVSPSAPPWFQQKQPLCTRAFPTNNADKAHTVIATRQSFYFFLQSNTCLGMSNLCLDNVFFCSDTEAPHSAPSNSYCSNSGKESYCFNLREVFSCLFLNRISRLSFSVGRKFIYSFYSDAFVPAIDYLTTRAKGTIHR